MFIMQKGASVAAGRKKSQLSQLSKRDKQRCGNALPSVLLIKSQAVGLSPRVLKCEEGK